MRTRILLADDHVVVRQGLELLLERQGFVVVAAASDGSEALELARQHRPDVALLDIVMPRMSGLEAARQMERVCPAVRVIFLTMCDDDPQVLDALQGAVRGLVVKTQPAEDLFEAIDAVQRGGTYVGAGRPKAGLCAAPPEREVTAGPLSPREREVLQLVADGRTTKQVAAVLNISWKTADFHRARLMKKLNIHETAGLVRYAVRHGLIAP